MIARYAVLASRIRQDVSELERVVDRVERAAQAYRQNATERELFLDAAALDLHDYSTGLERIFTHIGAGVDQSVPSGPDWHRELLRQMTVEVPGLRPQVQATAAASSVDEFLRFRHVVRHIYAFELEPERIERLASRLRTTLLAFANVLERSGSEDQSDHDERKGASSSRLPTKSGSPVCPNCWRMAAFSPM